MRALLALLVALAACHNPPADDSVRSPLSASDHSGPRPVVSGTVLDARSGKPVAGAVVRGADGVETKSDARGRFVLRGLERGWQGDLVATTEAGLTGRNRLRALEGGNLEVVLFVR